MMNMNDLRVEQEIAQERYRPLIEARRLERLTYSTQTHAPVTHRLLHRVGRRLEQWGAALQARYSAGQQCCGA